MRTRRAFLIVLVAFSVSCRYLRRPAVKSAEEAKVERGQALYVANCASCHGHFRFAGRAPDLYVAALVARDKNGDVIGSFIRAGRPDVGMPSFAFLTDAQIGDLGGFLDRTAAEIRVADRRRNKWLPATATHICSYWTAPRVRTFSRNRSSRPHGRAVSMSWEGRVPGPTWSRLPTERWFRPASFGATNWGGAQSFDPVQGLFYLCARRSSDAFYTGVDGQQRGWGGKRFLIESESAVEAIDYRTGEVRSKHEMGSGESDAGILTTAGGRF